MTFTLNKLKLFAYHVLLPLITGTLIYLIFRNKSIIMFRWFDSLLLTAPIEFLRNSFHQYRSLIPDWIIYSLPDGLWIYALSMSLFFIWGNDYLKTSIWLVIALLLAPSLEIMQYFHFLPGTFDWRDLIIYIIASFSGVLIIKLKLQKHEK
jgi:hypothetical protein